MTSCKEVHGKVLGDLCTTVDQMLHMIALHAMSTRVEITTVEAAL
ncbi:MAG: hypothetical protein ACE366_00920 [Bradymonadia bacterium]